MNIRVTRVANGPIIGPHLHPSIGVNIQGGIVTLVRSGGRTGDRRD
jgi:hypothetical protein